jgi:Glycosyltransferase like family
MISVLICSSNPDLLKQARDNIHETIGVDFEILYIDNRALNRGICTVYNELALQAQYPFLCFVHEDVLFETKDWGEKIMEIFSNDPSIGLIGLAGCKYKSSYYSGWFSGMKNLDCANYIHQYKSGTENVHLSPSNDNSLQAVACIDGVFMCASREVWSCNKFDEVFLKGFHFYDIDFSLRIARQYKVVVTYDFILKHITTGGDYGNNWVDIAINYHLHIKRSLPYSITRVDEKVADRRIVIVTLDFLKNYNISLSKKMKWITYQKLHLSPFYFYPVLKFLYYKPLGLKYLHQLLKNK